MSITERIRLFIEENGLVSKGESLLLAVSGGADSVCMLYILNELKDAIATRYEEKPPEKSNLLNEPKNSIAAKQEEIPTEKSNIEEKATPAIFLVIPYIFLCKCRVLRWSLLRRHSLDTSCYRS